MYSLPIPSVKADGKLARFGKPCTHPGITPCLLRSIMFFGRHINVQYSLRNQSQVGFIAPPSPSELKNLYRLYKSLITRPPGRWQNQIRLL